MSTSSKLRHEALKVELNKGRRRAEAYCVKVNFVSRRHTKRSQCAGTFIHFHTKNSPPVQRVVINGQNIRYGTQRAVERLLMRKKH